MDIYNDRILGIIIGNVPIWHRRAVSNVFSPSPTLPLRGGWGGTYFYPPVEWLVFRRTLELGTSLVIILPPRHRFPRISGNAITAPLGPFSHRCLDAHCAFRSPLHSGLICRGERT